MVIYLSETLLLLDEREQRDEGLDSPFRDCITFALIPNRPILQMIIKHHLIRNKNT